MARRVLPTDHPEDVRPLVGSQGSVMVDGRPICAVCGTGVEPVGPARWSHVSPGSEPRQSRWLSPVTIEELRRLGDYREFGERYPWAVRPDFGGPFVTSEEEWREGVRRLERYHAALDDARRMERLRVGENPYLSLVRMLSSPVPGASSRRSGWPIPPGLAQMLHLSERRRELAALFAWAIPEDCALDVLARHAPIVECGAGTGYWAALLRLRDVDVLAYDLAPPGSAGENPFHRRPGTWTEVVRGSSVAGVRRHPDRSLLLCWPPYADDSASYRVLRAYGGDALLYVGEPGEGATGSLRFHRELALNWTPVETAELLRWPGLRDRVTVYRRNPRRRPLLERDRCFQCGRFIPTGAIGRCDRCFELDPPAVAIRAGEHRVEYPEEMLAGLPAALRSALERSPNRIY